MFCLVSAYHSEVVVRVATWPNLATLSTTPGVAPLLACTLQQLDHGGEVVGFTAVVAPLHCAKKGEVDVHRGSMVPARLLEELLPQLAGSGLGELGLWALLLRQPAQDVRVGKVACKLLQGG